MSDLKKIINFPERITNYLGRNGSGKCIGLQISQSLFSSDQIVIAPINSKKNVARCNIFIPVDSIPDIVKSLEELHKTYQEDSQENVIDP